MKPYRSLYRMAQKIINPLYTPIVRKLSLADIKSRNIAAIKMRLIGVCMKIYTHSYTHNNGKGAAV